MLLDSKTARRAKVKAIGLWTLQILTAAAFFMAGYSKLSGDPAMVGMFEKIGMGQGLRYLTGAIEVSSAVMLVVPGLDALGAFLLVGTMAGAVMTHLFVIGGTPLPALVLGSIAAFILWARFETVKGWFAPRPTPQASTYGISAVNRKFLHVQEGTWQYQTR
jgi:hypothetical protein